MARKKKHEEHENHERWLISYADFITLLFAFFVVMYSVSSVNEGKFRVLSDALLAAFRSPQKTLTPIQIGSPAKAPQTDNLGYRQMPNIISAPDLPIPDVGRQKKGLGGTGSSMAEIADSLEQSLARLIDEDLIAVRHNDDYIEIEIKSSVLFEAASVKLTDDARKVVESLGKILRNFPNLMRIEGFTDNRPINSGVLSSNWVLSAARAASVVQYFEKLGVHPGRMSAVGYGEHRPVADNDSAEGRFKNRRVSIVVLNQTEANEIREDLYLASTTKDGKPPRQALGYAEPVKGWTPPRDVTSDPVIDRGQFMIVPPPIYNIAPQSTPLAPSVENVESVPYSPPLSGEGEIP